MSNERRVGTLTAGIILVTFGTLFLLRIFYPSINYSFILSLWPLILVFLGVELIISYIINKDKIMKYDGWSIFLIIVLSFFSMVMGGAEFVLNNFLKFNHFLTN
jgi:hypothetical protein